MQVGSFIFEFPVYVIVQPVGDGSGRYLAFAADDQQALCVFTERELAESLLFVETVAGTVLAIDDANTLIEVLLKRDRSITMIAMDPNFQTRHTRALPVAAVLEGLCRLTGML